MTRKQNKPSGKDAPDPGTEGQNKQDEATSDKPIVTRHTQTGQQQG